MNEYGVIYRDDKIKPLVIKADQVEIVSGAPTVAIFYNNVGDKRQFVSVVSLSAVKKIGLLPELEFDGFRATSNTHGILGTGEFNPSGINIE